ncbi:MAG: hypothetical protein ACFFCW_45910, partial [Candidatus Hodarchaeota archaeon]
MNKNQKGAVLPLFLGIIIIIIAISLGYLSVRKPAPLPAINTLTPSSTSDNLSKTPSTIDSNSNSFNYKTFSLSYPQSWRLLTLGRDDNFPLKERLSSLYASDKVISLNKGSTYLIITIEGRDAGQAGGIFIDEEEYKKFISDKDKVIIGE